MLHTVLDCANDVQMCKFMLIFDSLLYILVLAYLDSAAILGHFLQKICYLKNLHKIGNLVVRIFLRYSRRQKRVPQDFLLYQYKLFQSLSTFEFQKLINARFQVGISVNVGYITVGLNIIASTFFLYNGIYEKVLTVLNNHVDSHMLQQGWIIVFGQ